MNPFARTELLLKEEYENIKNLSVLILGLGGVGSYTVESLARLGVKKLILVDDDWIDETNINRQIEALHSTIGKYKADVLKERILDIHPTCTVIIVKERITEKTVVSLWQEPIDYLVDACDTMSVKKEIMKECTKRKQKFISCMGTANKIDPTQLKIMNLKDTSYDPIAKILRKEAKKLGIRTKIPVICSMEKPIQQATLGSVSFVPSVAGLLITSYIVKDVLYGKDK